MSRDKTRHVFPGLSLEAVYTVEAEKPDRKGDCMGTACALRGVLPDARQRQRFEKEAPMEVLKDQVKWST